MTDLGPQDPDSAWIPKPKGKRRYRRRLSPKQNAIEWAVIILVAGLAAVVIRTFFFQAFYIPSESMENTLIKGDRVIVNKLSYKLHDIHRGDVVVFEKPTTAQAKQCYARNDIKDLIKRVIGLPGETIEMVNGKVEINGTPLHETYRKPGTTPGPPIEKQKVPEDSVFVMGDNRDASSDSRCAGPIPKKDIVGRAFIVVWPVPSWALL